MGQAKLTNYRSRRYKVDTGVAQHFYAVFTTLVKTRIMWEYGFYKAMTDVAKFKHIWGGKELSVTWRRNSCLWMP